MKIVKGTVKIGGEVQDICEAYVGDRLARHSEMAKRIAELEAAFVHHHTKAFDGTDLCERCGFDLRDPIHTRSR